MPELKENIRKYQWVLAVVGLLVMAVLILYYFFVVGKFAAYPWWHRNTNDADASYVATTIALLNNSRYTYITHPGATLCAWLGMVYSGLAVVNPAYGVIFDLPTITDTAAINVLLNLGVQTGRVAVLVSALAFMLVLYLLLYRLVRQHWIAFLVCFYIIISKAFLQHTYQIRDELLSLFFVLLAGLVSLRLFEPNKHPARSLARVMAAGILTGCCLGLAIFSKIQIGPFIIFFITLVSIGVFVDAPLSRKGELPPRYLCGLGFFNLLFLPWWALWRPDFLTADYLQSLHPLSDYRRVYGGAPLHFCWPVLSLLLLFLLVNTAWALWPSFRQTRMMRRTVPVLFYIQLMLTGLSLSVYAILIPLSRTWMMYIENTRHLVYATLANVVYGGFLVNKTLGFQTLGQIYLFHGRYTRILSVNILFVILAVLGLAAIQVCKNRAQRLAYLFVIGVILLGLGMDVLGTFRWTYKEIADYYAVYSILCYGLGSAIWLSLSFRSAQGKSGSFYPACILAGLLFLHIGGQFFFLFQLPHAQSSSAQDPWIEYETLYSHGQPFWEGMQKKTILKKLNSSK